MKDAISAQQQQIQQLQQQISTRDQAIQQLQSQVTQAQSSAQQAQQAANAAANSQSTASADQIGALQHDVTDLKTVSGSTVNELQETQKRVAGLENPLSIDVYKRQQFSVVGEFPTTRLSAPTVRTTQPPDRAPPATPARGHCPTLCQAARYRRGAAAGSNCRRSPGKRDRACPSRWRIRSGTG